MVRDPPKPNRFQVYWLGLRAWGCGGGVRWPRLATEAGFCAFIFGLELGLGLRTVEVYVGAVEAW